MTVVLHVLVGELISLQQLKCPLVHCQGFAHIQVLFAVHLCAVLEHLNTYHNVPVDMLYWSKIWADAGLATFKSMHHNHVICNGIQDKLATAKLHQYASQVYVLQKPVPKLT